MDFWSNSIIQSNCLCQFPPDINYYFTTEKSGFIWIYGDLYGFIPMKQQIVAHFDWMIGSFFDGELPNFEGQLAMDFMVNTLFFVFLRGGYVWVCEKAQFSD